MTRTSAIFGVVSVLMAAIVGGVFIRKKIIDDILYERELSELEILWKRKIKRLENYISVLDFNLEKENKNKDNLEKEIVKYEKDMEELSESIKLIEEKIVNSKYYVITKKIDETITKNIDRQKNLKKAIEMFSSEINKLNSSTLNYEKTNSEDDIKLKIKNLQEILKTQKIKLEKHANRRIKLYDQFKQYNAKKEEAIEHQEKTIKELEGSKSSLVLLESLVQKLMIELKEKTLQLSILKKQNPRKIN